MKRILSIILIAVLVTAAGAGGYFYARNQAGKQIDRAQNQISEKVKELREKEKEIDKLKKEAKEQKASSASKSETKGRIVSPKGLFKIDLPQNGDLVTSPARIKGWANVFEAQFEVRIKDAGGDVLGSKNVTATQGPPEGGTFDTSLVFTQPSERTEGTIEIYDRSEKDGSIIDMATINVTIGEE